MNKFFECNYYRIGFQYFLLIKSTKFLTFNILLQEIHVQQRSEVSPTYARRRETVQLFDMQHEILHAEQHEEALGHAQQQKTVYVSLLPQDIQDLRQL